MGEYIASEGFCYLWHQRPLTRVERQSANLDRVLYGSAVAGRRWDLSRHDGAPALVEAFRLQLQATPDGVVYYVDPDWLARTTGIRTVQP